MAMQICGNYNHSGTDYIERMKEKQAAERAEKAKEAGKEAEEKNSGRQSEPQDEYISSEKSGKKPTGLYRVGQDENGSPKILFDDPKTGRANPKAGHANGMEDRSKDEKRPKADGNSHGKPVEKCIANTDKVDREIEKLREEKQQLEQQIQSAFGDEKKIQELEKKLAQIENELREKDNDTYRRNHIDFL